jgi:hypothetical protein
MVVSVSEVIIGPQGVHQPVAKPIEAAVTSGTAAQPPLATIVAIATGGAEA